MSSTIDAPSGLKWTQISGGDYFFCGLTTTSSVYCWGDNTSGELGTGDNRSSDVPMPVVGLQADVSSIDAGSTHACALLTDGTAKCWGDNWVGELGDGNSHTSSNVPVNVQGIDATITKISAGFSTTCARTSEGALKCWGFNRSGELGALFDQGYSPKPLQVWGLENGVLDVEAGYDSTCAIKTDGAWCWGDNSSGQLGLGSYWKQIPIPAQVPSLGAGTTTEKISTRTGCAILNGGAYCSGQDRTGSLGSPPPNLAPGSNKMLPVKGLDSGVTELQIGQADACVITTASAVKCWGSNQSGALGNGNPNNGIEGSTAGPTMTDYTPVTPLGLDKDVASIGMAFFGAACAVMTDGSAKCWGHGYQGQLGNGTAGTIMNNVPAPLGVTDQPKITTSSLPEARVGQPYNATLTSTDGSTPLSWAIALGGLAPTGSGPAPTIAAGWLPAGLAFDPATGVVSGTPTTVGTYQLGFRATGADGAIGWTRGSDNRWIEGLALVINPAQSAIPQVTSVSVSYDSLFKMNKATVGFTSVGTATGYNVKCTNTAGTRNSTTTTKTSPGTVYLSSNDTITCKVRANTPLGYTEWSAPSAPVTP